MKPINLANATVAELVEHFTALAVGQDEAEKKDNIAKYNQLIRKMMAVEAELKSRAGDPRRALLHLYGHSNMQVRLMAAKATLAVEPETARQALQAIADSGWFPQAGNAGMSLWNLERGVFKPSELAACFG